MPRRAGHASAEDVILQAVESVVERASAGIARAISEILSARIDEELKAQVARAVGKGRKGRVARGAARRVRQIDRWVADRRARRVPELRHRADRPQDQEADRGQYGENAAFEKGKAAPKAK